MAFGKLQRLAHGGDVDIGIAFQQRQRSEPQFARGEHQPAAIGLDGVLLRIGRVLKLLALDYDGGLQPSYERGGRICPAAPRAWTKAIERTFSSRISCATVTPGVEFGIDADDENIGLFRRKLQKPQMSGMDDVEVAGDERDGLVRAAGSANLLAHDIGVRSVDQLVQGSPFSPISFASEPRGARKLNRLAQLTCREKQQS